MLQLPGQETLQISHCQEEEEMAKLPEGARQQALTWASGS